MSVKWTGQLGFGGLAALVDWSEIEAALTGLREEGPERPGYRPLLLFKALLLQAWYGLSDAELEFRLGDSLAYGYKAHGGVDQGSGRIRAIAPRRTSTTPS